MIWPNVGSFVRPDQKSGQSLSSLANSGQTLLGLAKDNENLFFLANTEFL